MQKRTEDERDDVNKPATANAELNEGRWDDNRCLSLPVICWNTKITVQRSQGAESNCSCSVTGEVKPDLATEFDDPPQSPLRIEDTLDRFLGTSTFILSLALFLRFCWLLVGFVFVCMLMFFILLCFSLYKTLHASKVLPWFFGDGVSPLPVVSPLCGADMKPTTLPPLQLNPPSGESLNLESGCALIKDPRRGPRQENKPRPSLSSPFCRTIMIRAVMSPYSPV